jgi:hypothetical protein
MISSEKKQKKKKLKETVKKAYSISGVLSGEIHR